MDEQEWRYFLAGPTGDVKVPNNPTTWISENSWPDIYNQIRGMNKLEKLNGIETHFMQNPDDFRHIFDSQQAHKQALPEPW